MVRKAVCVIEGHPGVYGIVQFEQIYDDEATKITGEIKGLTPGLHGFHVHEWGDNTQGCTSAGAHFNPHQRIHGGPKSEGRHMGDLGNIRANPDGVARFHICDRLITLAGEHSIIGRTLVVHQNVDDLGKGGNEESLKTGNAGERIGCGVIGIVPS